MRTLLVDNFKFIFLHLVKNGQQEDLQNVSEYLKVCFIRSGTYNRGVDNKTYITISEITDK